MSSKKKTPNEARKYVFLFDEYDAVMALLANDWDAVRALLGGKHAATKALDDSWRDRALPDGSRPGAARSQAPVSSD